MLVIHRELIDFLFFKIRFSSYEGFGVVLRLGQRLFCAINTRIRPNRPTIVEQSLSKKFEKLHHLDKNNYLLGLVGGFNDNSTMAALVCLLS